MTPTEPDADNYFLIMNGVVMLGGRSATWKECQEALRRFRCTSNRFNNTFKVLSVKHYRMLQIAGNKKYTIEPTPEGCSY